MGNHVAGRAVGLAAEQALRARQPGETALDILDRVCETYRRTDAEFESMDPNDPASIHPEFEKYTDPHPKAALGMLMLEAFAPNGVADLGLYDAMMGSENDNDEGEAEELAYDRWWDDVYEPFRKRYGFY